MKKQITSKLLFLPSTRLHWAWVKQCPVHPTTLSPGGRGGGVRRGGGAGRGGGETQRLSPEVPSPAGSGHTSEMERGEDGLVQGPGLGLWDCHCSGWKAGFRSGPGRWEKHQGTRAYPK